MAMPGVAQIDGWVTIAQPRARIVYHRGDSLLDCVGGVPARLRLLFDHGLVSLHVVRDEATDPTRPIAYLAVRTDKPAPKGLAALGPAVVPVPRAPAVVKGPRPLGPGGRVW